MQRALVAICGMMIRQVRPSWIAVKEHNRHIRGWSGIIISHLRTEHIPPALREVGVWGNLGLLPLQVQAVCCRRTEVRPLTRD